MNSTQALLLQKDSQMSKQMIQLNDSKLANQKLALEISELQANLSALQICANEQTTVIKDQTVQIDELLEENQRLMALVIKQTAAKADKSSRQAIGIQTDPVLLSDIAIKPESTFRPEFNLSSF